MAKMKDETLIQYALDHERVLQNTNDWLEVLKSVHSGIWAEWTAQEVLDHVKYALSLLKAVKEKREREGRAERCRA